MKKKKCLVCGSLNLTKILTSTDPRNKQNTEKFDYLECSACQSIQLDPKHTRANFYTKYYGGEYHLKDQGLKPGLERFYARFVNSMKLKLMLNYLDKHKIDVLDVGAGDLSFLNSLPAKKFKKSSIDMHSSKQKPSGDVSVFDGDFISYNFGRKKFGAIVSWHSLEHFEDPKLFLKKVYTLLSKGGYAFISTPDTESLGFKFFKNAWYHLDAPRHLVVSNEYALSNLASKIGFSEMKSAFMFYEFPFDLWRSTSKANIFAKVFIILFYPLLKLIDKETMTLVLKKK